MGEKIKRDVKLLLLLAVALALFNVVSLQMVVLSGDGNGVRTAFNENALPSEDKQQGAILINPSGQADPDKNNLPEQDVYSYINDKLKKYGYNPIDTSSVTNSNNNPNGASEDNEDSQTPSSSTDDSNKGTSEDNSESGGGAENSGDSLDSSGGENEGGGFGGGVGEVVSPNEDGPPAVSVEGKDLTFDFGFGVK
ncbi:MAG: hypothetical protein KKD18_03825 [Nanoarchaeota archaeon]|nr:hypothetical protein [Nanoarchaeota archaeon]